MATGFGLVRIPLPEGIKRFNLKHFDGEDEFFHKNIIILREKINIYHLKFLDFLKIVALKLSIITKKF